MFIQSGNGRFKTEGAGSFGFLAFQFAGEPLKGDMLNGRIQDDCVVATHSRPARYTLTR